MGKIGVIGSLREQLSPVPPVARVDLTGKTVMIIGANTGLGFEACKRFSLMNPARIILACRDKVKCKAAISRLSKETGYKAGELWIIDLSKFTSVVAFADKFKKECGHLDILIANVGIVTSKYSTTSDGWEKT
ncbi:hypothetical protein C0995_010666 [Termitomyces sp. Mi166|nr:hypothetical protein C0995_010666 [Termitomyces sp. Mi166\